MDDPEQAFRVVLDEALDLMLRKQKDYGTGNIEAFGEAGVLVRMSDKINRLLNLYQCETPPENESIEDSWIDLLNYALIGVCLARGWVYHPAYRWRLVRDRR